MHIYKRIHGVLNSMFHFKWGINVIALSKKLYLRGKYNSLSTYYKVFCQWNLEKTESSKKKSLGKRDNFLLHVKLLLVKMSWTLEVRLTISKNKIWERFTILRRPSMMKLQQCFTLVLSFWKDLSLLTMYYYAFCTCLWI